MSSESKIWKARLRRISPFALIVITVLCGTTWFVCTTVNHFWGTNGFPRWEFVLFGLSFVFPVTSILGVRFENVFVSSAYRICALWLGILNYAFFAAIALWIFAGIGAIFSWPLDWRLCAEVFFGAGLLTTLLGIANAFWLRVRHVTVRLRNLPPAWQGQSAALVTDTHLGNVRGVAFSRRVVRALNSLPCKAVLISGDLFDGPKADFHGLLAPWKTELKSVPVFFVTGNHEEFSDRNDYIHAVEGAGIGALHNEKKELDGLQIVGVHDGELHQPKLLQKILREAGIDRNRASILLAHQPTHLSVVEEAGISLQVSGHTHGGQFWPWNYVARRVHGPFVRGLNRIGALQVFTSNGAGTWGPPMRVATRSEIILIRLENDTP